MTIIICDLNTGSSYPSNSVSHIIGPWWILERYSNLYEEQAVTLIQALFLQVKYHMKEKNIQKATLQGWSEFFLLSVERHDVVPNINYNEQQLSSTKKASLDFTLSPLPLHIFSSCSLEDPLWLYPHIAFHSCKMREKFPRWFLVFAFSDFVCCYSHLPIIKPPIP